MKVDIFNTDKKYQIIYADPPWKYHRAGNGKAENHYNVMDFEELSKIPLQSISDKNCILFMWSTYPNIQEALDLIKIWGFKYKTCGFQWIKKNKRNDGIFLGIGGYTRSNSEPCLLATKGRLESRSHRISQIIISHRKEHSRKPDEVRERIVELCGDVPRIELFARQKFDGWDCWGDEV